MSGREREGAGGGDAVGGRRGTHDLGGGLDASRRGVADVLHGTVPFGSKCMQGSALQYTMYV